MPEVKVEKVQMPAPRETRDLSPFNDVLAPVLPLGRFFGLNRFPDPFALMRDFGRDIDREFRKMPAPEAWTPVVDVQRCNGDLVISAELPGLKKEEIKVEVTGDMLTIEGERKREHKEDHEGYHRYERTYGKFFRSIPLPEGAKTDAAKAELTDGVLKISVPAPEAKKAARQIAVEQGAEKQPVAA